MAPKTELDHLIDKLEKIVDDAKKHRDDSATLGRIETALNTLIQRSANMVTKADFDAAIAGVRTEIADAITDRDAKLARIAELEALVAEGGMNAADETAALADVETLRAEVDAITPDEPAPEPTP